MISTSPCQISQLNLRDQSISLQLQKPSRGLQAQERETQPVGEWLCSVSSNQSQIAAGGASGRCECREQVQQPPPPNVLCTRFVSWGRWPRSQPAALRGRCQDMTASATRQLWPCWRKRGRAHSAKNTAGAQGNNCCSGILNCSH